MLHRKPSLFPYRDTSSAGLSLTFLPPNLPTLTCIHSHPDPSFPPVIIEEGVPTPWMGEWGVNGEMPILYPLYPPLSLSVF